MIKRLTTLLMVALMVSALAGCTADNLASPCANFGAHCRKVPVNSWDNQ